MQKGANLAKRADFSRRPKLWGDQNCGKGAGDQINAEGPNLRERANYRKMAKTAKNRKMTKMTKKTKIVKIVNFVIF